MITQAIETLILAGAYEIRARSAWNFKTTPEQKAAAGAVIGYAEARAKALEEQTQRFAVVGGPALAFGVLIASGLLR